MSRAHTTPRYLLSLLGERTRTLALTLTRTRTLALALTLTLLSLLGELILTLNLP